MTAIIIIRTYVLTLEIETIRKNIREESIMASESKKRKAKNSYLMYGADRLDLKMKRIAYYTKRDRNKKQKDGQNFRRLERYKV